MKRKIIVAPFQMHAEILAHYRANDVFCNLKIIDKRQLVSSILGQADYHLVPLIMEQFDINFDSAVSLLTYLPFINEKNEIDNYKIKLLQNIKTIALNHNLYKKVDYFELLFKEADVDVIGYSSYDQELTYLFNLVGVEPHYISLGKDETKHKIYTNIYVEDEIFNTLNRIALLIDQGVDINNIFIYVEDEDYLYYLNKYKKDFHFEINVNETNSLFTQALTNKVLSLIKESKDFFAADEFLNTVEDDNKTYINELLLEVKELPYSFDIAFSYFVGQLEKTYLKNAKYFNAVNVINKPIYQENAYIFVMNFKQGVYTRIYKDNEFILDADKKYLNMNSTLDKGKMDIDLLTQFFNSNNHFTFSFAYKSKTDNNYLSPMVDALHMEVIKDDYMETIYAKKQARYILCKLTDTAILYKDETPTYLALKKLIEIPYGQYNNQYTFTNVYSYNSFLKHSYTSIDNYYRCPFKYYLSNILKIDPFEGNFNSNVGLLLHEILSLQHQENVTFESLYPQIKQKYAFTKKEEVFLANLVPQFKRVFEATKLHERYMLNAQIYLEKNLDIPLNKYSVLKGTIDKMIVLDDRFLVFVDYKTGKLSLDLSRLKNGGSLQLPTYALIASSHPDFNHYTTTGLYINEVMTSELKNQDLEDNLIPSYLKLNGLSLDNIEALNALDNSLCSGGKSEFIGGVYIKKDGSLKTQKKIINQDEMDEIINTTKKLFLDADMAIRNNIFLINPIWYSDRESGCTYCSYKDICHLRNHQIKYAEGSNKDSEEN